MPTSSHPPALYAQVAEKIEKLIRSGTLRVGEKIPSVRRASLQHRVSITTAVQAYLALESRGIIEARPKSGFYVRSQFRQRASEPAVSRPAPAATTVGVGSLQARLFDAARMPDVVPLGAAYPGPGNLPVTQLNRLLAAAARTEGERGISYDMPPGAESLRRQIARRYIDAGCALSPEDIITTCGGTEALLLCLRAVARAGDVIAVESPTYFGILQVIEELGLRALEVPMHPRDGLDLEALDRALRTRRVAACLAVPNFSNPLGSLMPEENKRRLVELLASRGVPLIEDDINGDLVHRGERPRVARSYDTAGNVLLCGSFSKTIAPGYRVGWVAPGRFYERVKALKITSTLATATLPQLAIAEFLTHGGYDRHLRSLRRRFSSQVERMSLALADAFSPDIKLSRPSGGFILWVELPKSVSALDLHQRALAEKISIAPGPMFSARQDFQNFIRLNCGHPWTSQTQRAIEVLGRLVRKLM